MDVKTYSDEQLQSLLKDIHKELDKRKMEHIKTAKEQIKKIAIDAGISVSFTDVKAPRKRTQKIQTPPQPITKKVEIKVTEKIEKTENKELEEVI